MESFLEHLEKNYNTFNIFDGDLNSFKFPDDVTEVITILMKKTNELYINKCKHLGTNPKVMSDYQLLKDCDGKCYLKITGGDKKTNIIIRQDNSDFSAYKSMLGRKITESDFMQILDVYQRERLARANIPSRFIKDEIPEIKGREEVNTKSLIEYYEYLKSYYLDSISKQKRFLEPDVEKQRTNNKRDITEQKDISRKNEIIDYEIRKQELLKYKPFTIINFVGSKSQEEIDVYVYERDGYILAIAEPISGEKYTKIMNLGFIDPSQKELIENNIQAALEASEDIILKDDAIIRKSHTTLDIFIKNLEVLLNANEDMKRFYDDVEASKSVYKR